jgi:hypothetical protein
VVDEGSVAGSFTGRPLAPGQTLAPGDVIAVQESLATWEGWSLAAARPGRVISADPLDADAVHRAENGTEVAVRPSNEALTSAGVRIETSALPGSLPRLRFGRTYRIRLRTVDLAGNSLTVAQADEAMDDESVTDAVMFRRFEPVMPPVVAFSPGDQPPLRVAESERRLVVRSGLDAGDETFGSEPGASERLLFAPECAVSLAEWHGTFDDAMGTTASAEARTEAYRLAARESETLEPGASEVPWLPDPGSAGICLSELPGMSADEVLTVAWPTTPSGPGPIRLRAVAIDADELRRPEVDEGRATVTVFLPPGARCSAQVSSVLADVDLLALPALWRARLDPGDLALVEAKLATHRHGMVTPTVPIEFVHATQRPKSVPRAVGPPELGPRQPDQTHVLANVRWEVHAPSTGAIELHASWTVPKDEPIEADSPEAAATAGDRDHAAGTWVAAANAIRTMAGRSTIVPPVPVDGPFMTEVTMTSASADGVPVSGASLELDTTAHVRLRLRAIATSRFAEFFPPEYGPAPETDSAPPRESRLTSISEELVLDVPSTRRPQPPVVLEVLPLVVRNREPGRILREGGWLRIWLARPWFSTGWDESPAVIASPDGQPLRPTSAEGYDICTLVGPDPAREVPAFTGITPHALGGFPEEWVEVRLMEMMDAEAAGMGRAIALSDRTIDWDPDRGAWFVDVRIDVPELYFPFVRLVIARDQPHSIRGQGLVDEFRVSPVVALDPIQVLPDRELRHTVVGNGVKVELVGPSYEVALMPVNHGSPEAPDWIMEPIPGGAPSQARVVAQKRVRSGGDELLAWEDMFERIMVNSASVPSGTLVAELTLPFDPTDPPGDFRLLVIEEDFSYGLRSSFHEEGPRARVTFVETVELPRAVAPPS